MVESSFLSTKVELFLCARNIPNMDTFSKSDPYCVAYIQTPPTNQYTEIGRTETVRDDLNPNWSRTIIADFFFETKQCMKFSVFDYDESKPDNLGEVYVTLGEIVGKGTMMINLPKKGKLIIRVEEVKNSLDQYEFHLRGKKLDKKDLFGKSDPYLIFYRSLGGNSWSEVHRTEIIKNTLDPLWKPIHISGQKLCNGDGSRPIKIECFDWDMIGSHDLIGIAETKLDSLSEKGYQFTLHNPSKKKNVSSGTIEVSNVIRKRILSFIDYLRAGTQISFSIAIDYTASNGEYSNPTSLHHVSPGGQNQYERAIWEVGSILEAYDSDKFFPVFGFGGVPVHERSANHCFSLTFDASNPYVHGVQGILDAYRRSLNCVSLSGPTLFHHVIDSTASVARSVAPHEVYSILLILTDGAIMDMDQTLTSIVNCSSLPMSIIIVGVGNADFSSMEALDSDNGVLTDGRGMKAARDIVQFVPFNRFGGNPVALAAEVLKEVPRQLTEFMGMINYAPVIPEQVPIEVLAPIVVENTEELPPLDVPSMPPGYEYSAPELPPGD